MMKNLIFIVFSIALLTQSCSQSDDFIDKQSVFEEEIVEEEISIGDYVLTGGELPAMVLIDSVSRYVKGVLKEDSVQEESFTNGLLEYPQYTRPEVFLGKRVPEVLLFGHHENIKKWRRNQSIINTYLKRPDLLREIKLSDKEQKMLSEYKNLKEGGSK